VQREDLKPNKVGKLLDHVEHRGATAFDSFVNTLVETQHEHVAALLTAAVKQTVKPNDSSTSDGNTLFQLSLVLQEYH